MARFLLTVSFYGLLATSQIFAGDTWLSGDCAQPGGRNAIISGDGNAAICPRARSRAQTDFDNGVAAVTAECTRLGGDLTVFQAESHYPTDREKCSGGGIEREHHQEETLTCNCTADFQAAQACAVWGQEVVRNAYTSASSNKETLADICRPDFGGAKPEKIATCDDHWLNIWRRADGRIPTQARCNHHCAVWMDKMCRDVPNVNACVARWFDPNRKRDSATLWAYARGPGMDDNAFAMCEMMIRNKCKEENWLPEKWLQFCSDSKLALPVPEAVKTFIKNTAAALVTPTPTPVATAAPTMPQPAAPLTPPMTNPPRPVMGPLPMATPIPPAN